MKTFSMRRPKTTQELEAEADGEPIADAGDNHIEHVGAPVEPDGERPRDAIASVTVAAGDAGGDEAADVAVNRASHARTFRNSAARARLALRMRITTAARRRKRGFGQAPRPESAATNGEGGDTPEGRRRRRRGRRGGRRNKHRNGELRSTPTKRGPEPSLQRAAADMDQPPANYQSAPAYTPPPYEPRSIRRGANSQRSTARAATPALDHPRAGPDRRRSSGLRRRCRRQRRSSPVRRPRNAATPKRGWWGKRLIGDKD